MADNEFLDELELDPESDTEEFLSSGPEPDVDPSLTEPVSAPSADLLKEKAPTARAREYQRKTRGILAQGFKATVGQPNTVVDAATILLYEKRVSRAAGDLADASDGFRNTIDFLSTGGESPFAAFALAIVPPLLQVVRNHEQALEPKPRGGIRIPFTKRKFLGGIRLGVRLGKYRAATNHPVAMYNAAFNDDAVVRAIKRQGISIAVPDDRN